MTKKQASLTRATLILTGVGIISQALGFFYRVILSRLIGAETMGLYQLIMPVYSVIISITMTGLTVALSSLSAGYYTIGNQRATTQLLFSALRTLVLLWVPVALAICLFSRQLSAQVLGDIRTREGLVLLLPVLLLTGVENLNKHHFYGIGETQLPAAVEIGEQFIRTAAILGLLALLLPLSQAHTVAVIVIGMLISEVFSSFTLTAARYRREGPYRTQPGKLERPSVIRRKLSGVAIPVSAAALLNNLISSANSVLIPRQLVQFGLTEQTATEFFGVVFGMTLPLLMLPFAFVNALSLALLPQLTRCAALHRTAELNRKAKRALQAISLIVLPLLALLVPLGQDVGQLLFQDDRVGLYALPISINVALSAYESILATTLNGVGKQSWSAAVSLLCGVIQLCFTVLGINRFGFPAYLVGMLLSSALGLLLRLGILVRFTGFSLDIYNCFTAPCLAALFSGLCVNLFYRILCQNTLPLCFSLALSACVGLFLYLSVLSAQGFSLPASLMRFISASHSSMHRKRSS